MKAALALLAALCAGAASASAPRNVLGFSIQKPKADWGGLGLAVIHLDPSDDLAPGYYCDPPEPGEEDNSICLGASMFDQEGSIQRFIAATPDFGDMRFGKFRTIGGHAARSIGSGWYLALLERTKSGYTWVPWRTPLERGRACLPQALIKQFAVTVPADATTDASGERCFKAWRSF